MSLQCANDIMLKRTSRLERRGIKGRSRPIDQFTIILWVSDRGQHCVLEGAKMQKRKNALNSCGQLFDDDTVRSYPGSNWGRRNICFQNPEC